MPSRGCRPGRVGRVAASGVTALVVTAAIAVASLGSLAGPASTRHSWREWASTNLDNLGDHPLGAMVVSAFLVDGDLWVWLVLSLVGLAATGRVLGNVRTAVLAGLTHVLATLLSEGLLAWRIRSGAVGPAARHIVDVGPSYLVVGALVAAIAYGTWPGRLLSAAGFAVVAPYLFEGLGHLEVSAVGHVCSVGIGLAGGFWLRRRPALPDRRG